MNISDKTLRRVFLVAAVVLVLGSVAAAHIMYRISQNRDGICVSEGRVLSDDELRRRVIENVVKNKIDVIQAHDNAVLKAGIAPEISDEITEEAFVPRIENAYHNEKSFEENFYVEVVSPRRKSDRFNLSALLESFMLVVYSDRSATLYPMVSVQRELIDVREIDHHFGLAETYAGFGRHFYQMSVVSLPWYCCFKNPNLSREEYQEYLSKKMIYYQDWLKSGRKITIHQTLMAASNCGDVLLAPDDQNYRTLGIYQIEFLRRK